MAKKDIELEILHPQELQRIVGEKTRALELAEQAKRTADRVVREVTADVGIVTEGQRAALRRIGDQIRYSPALYPWMRAYAEWMTLECHETPKWSQRVAKVRSFAHAPIAVNQLKLLEARPDFVTYVRELQLGPLERARERFQAAYPEYVEAHREALDLARDKGDYNAIARIAEPVLDRVMPKKAEGGGAAQVTITLSASQLAGVSATYEAPAMLVDEVVAEVVPDE